MSKSSARGAIRLRGVRQNNLKNFDLDLPLNQLIVITGLSGSGKSSLAFDTLFAEGQRRYIETFSPYARQFFDRMDKPQVDAIEGIPPAIAIEQRNAVKTTRSTVGTMTEICDYMKLLWPHISQLYCRQCGRPVRKEPPELVWDAVRKKFPAGTELLITFALPLSDKLSLDESLALIAKQGYQRLLRHNRVIRLEEFPSKPAGGKTSRPSELTVLQDRVRLEEANRHRFVEACEQAYHFGKGKLTLFEYKPKTVAPEPEALNAEFFSSRLHCAQCDLEYREPTSALFSFNNPVGACPACRGFGRVIGIDYSLALPDRSLTLAGGAVKAWQTGQSAECQRDLMRMCRHHGVPTDVPFEELPKKWQEFVIEGEPGYGKDEEHQWPRAWYGLKGYFRWLESKAYKMHVRVLLSRYRAYTTCPTCQGRRFQPEALLYRVRLTAENGSPSSRGPGTETITLSDFYQLPICRALGFLAQLSLPGTDARSPFTLILDEVRSRLGYLQDVGLGYLTLDRPTRSLSGGETERVNLTTCLGTRLVNTLFVLDEPSVGLHSRDTDCLVAILERLRNAGNTVVVVEHEASVMRAANQIVDLGPGHGSTGGEIVFQGSYSEIVRSDRSLTGKYLGGRAQISVPARRPVSAVLRLSHATLHNLNNLTVEIPLARLVGVSGVSGSGKTTLIREILLPALIAKLKSNPATAVGSADEESGSDEDEREASGEASASLEFIDPGLGATAPEGPAMNPLPLSLVVLVDQSVLGKTPRSNPAVYIGAFDDIREVFAQSEPARQRGLDASAFSFNSSRGQCERCRGAGFEKIEMQFLSDVFIRCPDCNGRRYREHILEVKISPPGPVGAPALSIGDLLESTIEDARAFLAGFADSRPARRAATALALLEEVGLGYLRLGQPINTLSGGESQRLKLVRHLAEAPMESAQRPDNHKSQGVSGNPVLFLFDEPTTGLHFEDVRVLLKVFQRLVDAGHSVVVIEHNLEVLKSVDWLIDLGPDAGEQGGRLVAAGTPEAIAACTASHTGRALKPLLAL